MISVLTVFLFAGIGLSGESPIPSNTGEKGGTESQFLGNATEKWSESGSNADDLIAPRGTEAGNNTFYGHNAGGATSTGEDNAFFGYKAGDNVINLS